MYVNIHDAKTTLSRLVARVEAGEEVVLTRRNVPVARLMPLEGTLPIRVFGDLKDEFTVPASFFDPLPDDVLDDWER
jgi:prevent-host-death family protein